MNIEITYDIACKVLNTVDAGLSPGLGKPEPGHMCVEAAVCYALGLPHGDDPLCVSTALRFFKMRLNDARWSGPKTRAAGLRRLALAQLGSASSIDDIQLAKRLADLAGKWAANADAYADATAAAKAANAAAYAYANATAAADAVSYATTAAAYAAAAADAAAAAYASAAYAAAINRAATNAAAYAADARDEALSRAAEDVVQILISMGAPGAQWLTLAPLKEDNSSTQSPATGC